MLETEDSVNGKYQYTTDLHEDSVLRRTRRQRVRFVDIYTLRENRDWKLDEVISTRAVDGFTSEGHGNGIRILFDHKLPGDVARQLLEHYILNLKGPKPEEFEQDVSILNTETLQSLTLGRDRELAIKALDALRIRCGADIDHEVPF